jgi:hypothetical protein
MNKGFFIRTSVKMFHRTECCFAVYQASQGITSLFANNCLLSMSFDLFSVFFCRTKFCRIIWHWAVCILLLPRDGCGVHQLWKECILKSGTGVQEGHRRQEHPQSELGHISQGSIELLYSWRIPFLFQWNS